MREGKRGWEDDGEKILFRLGKECGVLEKENSMFLVKGYWMMQATDFWLIFEPTSIKTKQNTYFLTWEQKLFNTPFNHIFQK